MTQVEFEEQLAVLLDIPRKTITILIKTWVEVMRNIIVTGDIASLPRYGRWFSKRREAKNIYNPYYGVVIHYPVKNIVKFQAFTWSGQQVAPHWREYYEVTGFRYFPQCKVATDISLLSGIDILICNQFIYELADQLIYMGETDNHVSFENFGTFKLYFNKAHAGRNPRNGATVSVPARNKLIFKASKNLKDLVN
jgi:nucleoid DNA-binding protein